MSKLHSILVLTGTVLLLTSCAASPALPSPTTTPEPASSSATPAAPGSETPSATPEPSQPPTAVQAAIPACEDMFSSELSNKISSESGLVLNPEGRDFSEWKHHGTNDETLIALIDEIKSDHICRWFRPDGSQTELGIITNVMYVTASQQTEAEARLSELAETDAQFGGTRYVWEEDDPNGVWGESHLFRDGIWFATSWLNYGPDGYTEDMANHVFH